jgi:type I restriction enzyme S subunit
MTAGTQNAQAKTFRTFETNFEELAKSKILRCSTRFHNPPTKKLMEILNQMKTLKVKDVIQTYEKGIQPTYNQE